jgi:hypothetical protein
MQTDLSTPDVNRKLVKVVANAWLDPDYKQRLLGTPKKTIEEAGIDLPAYVNLSVVEDTPVLRNMILADKPLPPQARVKVLAAKPDFFSAYSYIYEKCIEDPAFKARFLAEPEAVLTQLGVAVPPGLRIRVYQDTDQERFFALPMTPKSRITIELNEASMAVLDATAVNANVNINANVQANVNADVTVNAAVQVNAAAFATVVVAVAVLI